MLFMLVHILLLSSYSAVCHGILISEQTLILLLNVCSDLTR